MTGTVMPIATTAAVWPVVVVGLGDAPRPREGKLTPDGRQTYASGCILRVMRGGEVRSDKSASVHVVEAASVYPVGETFLAAGSVWVQPYTPSGSDRGTLSITVERLVPEGGGASRRREATA